jgi:hypothetical protein
MGAHRIRMRVSCAAPVCLGHALASHPTTSAVRPS